ncbi:MAG: stage III sporulation protein AB [Oscillospiraceae bacterium]
MRTSAITSSAANSNLIYPLLERGSLLAASLFCSVLCCACIGCGRTKRRETDDLHKSGAGAVPAVAGTGHRADAARPGRARGGDLLPHRAAARAADAGKCVPAACRAVLPDDLDYLLERATRASVYAAADQIRQGYLQTAGGCRVGLCGCAYGQAAGQIDGIRQLSSVSVRIPHAVPGCADALVPQLMKDGFCSTLILSPPGGGKTTLLRECVRRPSDQGLRSLAYGRARARSRRCKPDAAARRRRDDDIMTGDRRPSAMMLLRAMRPDVLAFDEINAPEDIEAIRIAAGCGVALLATAHAQSVGALRCRTLYRALLDEHIFRRAVVHHAQRRRALYTLAWRLP